MHNFRMNYPNTYLTNMYILKFEKDVSSSSDIFFDDDTYQLTYTLVNAFPVNIVSTPVSYESSQILKYTVSMAFMRYTVDNIKIRIPDQ